MTNVTLYKNDNIILGEFAHQSVDTDPLNIRKATAILTAIDSGADLKNCDLSNSNFHESLEFENLNFTSCDFSYSRISSAKFTNCKFSNSIFYRADLSNCIFDNCNFDEAMFHHTNLSNSDLGNIKFGLADFFHTKLIGCKYNNTEIKTEPFFISGLDYPIIIINDSIVIGCETRTIAEWETYTTRDLIKLDNKKAGNFWNTWKDDIISISKKLSGYTQVNSTRETANVVSIASTTSGGLNVLA